MTFKKIRPSHLPPWLVTKPNQHIRQLLLQSPHTYNTRETTLYTTNHAPPSSSLTIRLPFSLSAFALCTMRGRGGAVVRG